MSSPPETSLRQQFEAAADKASVRAAQPATIGAKARLGECTMPNGGAPISSHTASYATTDGIGLEA